MRVFIVDKEPNACADELCVGAESVSVKVGQRLRRDGDQEIWHSVGVYAKEEEDGTLVVTP